MKLNTRGVEAQMLDVNFAKRFGLALGVNGFSISEKLFPYFSESWQILPLN